jgi:hypothetical protein
VVGGGDRVELLAGPPGGVEVACGDGDLDLGIQQRREGQVSGRWTLLRRDADGVADGFVDEGGGTSNVAPGEAYPCEPGVRAPGVGVCRRERLLGAVDVAPSEPDVPQLCEGPAELASHPRSEVVAGTEGLRLGGVGRSAHPQQLGAVDATTSVDPAERGVMAPPLHDLGPLGGSIVHGQALGRADELAQHHPGRQRIDLPGHQQGAHLVELVEALVDVAVEDGDASRGHPADDHRRLDPVPVPELDRSHRFGP